MDKKNKAATASKVAKNLVFFLGGADAEMRRIAEVLAEAGIEYHDAGLGWGAAASAYGDAIAEASGAGKTPVLVELEVDCDLPEGVVVVDHHGDRAGEPPAILQVLNLLGREPSRWDLLVAANDAGWFPGLVGEAEIPGMGRFSPPATAEEMAAVRATDRAAQGITPEQEREAERALAALVEEIGGVRVIRMSHSKTAPIGDRLAIDALASGRPIPAYLVLSGDGEVNFSGDGALAAALHEKFPGGWAGGAGLGKVGGSAFWGGYPDHEEALAFIREYTS